MNFTFPYKTKVEGLELAGVKLELESIESMNDTIDAFFEAYGETGNEELFGDLCPYFGQVWPAGLVLAEYMGKHCERWRGGRILEIGCGLALPSLLLAKLGCAVTAMDVHPDVAPFLMRNQERNQISGLKYQQGDWRKSDVGSDWSLIFGSDILYDKEQPTQLLDFLQEKMGPKTEVLIADPGRIYFNRFLRECQRMGWIVQEDLLDSVLLANISKG